MAIHKIPKKQHHKMLKNQKVLTDHSHDATSSVGICPFFITSGAVNLTERGEIDANLNKQDFTTFQKVFVGGSLITATWVDSTSAETVDVGDVEQKIHGSMRRDFKAGRVITANLSAETNTNVFEAVVGSESFTAQKTNRIFEVSILPDQWDEQYENCLFVVPEFGISQWLYLQSWTYERDADPDAGNAIRQVVLRFASLQDAISSTGNNVRQFVQRGAIGEAFAWPRLNAQTKAIELDDAYLQDTPITSIQFEFDAPMAVSSLSVFGRTVSNAETNDLIECPQHLMVSRFNSPQTNEITKIGNATPNFYVARGNMSFEGWTAWKDDIQDAYDEFRSKNFEGYLSINYTETAASNPPSTATAAGYYQYQLWANNWLSTAGVEGTYDTQPDYFTGDRLTIGSGTPMYDVLNHTQFIAGQFLKLPLSIKEHTVVAFSSIPILGTAVKAITGGIPLGWSNTQVIIPAQNIPMFIPAELVEFSKAQGSNDNLVPAELFRGIDNNDSIGGLLSTNTTFNVELTHLFDKGTGTPIQNTNELGQVDADGNKIVWDGNCRSVPSGYESINEGYILDNISIKALGKANVKITAFRGSQKVYEGVIQTKSKYTGEIREWATDIKCSFWDRPDVLSGEQINYPEAITPPPLPDGSTGLQPIVIEWGATSSMELESVIGKNSADGPLLLLLDDAITETIDLSQYNLTVQEVADNYSLIRVQYEIGTTGSIYNTSIIIPRTQKEIPASELGNFQWSEQIFNKTENNEFQIPIGWPGGTDIKTEGIATISLTPDINDPQKFQVRLSGGYAHTVEGLPTNGTISDMRPSKPHENSSQLLVLTKIELIP